MKDRDLIGRLLELRRHREQRAKEAAMRDQAAFDRAAQATRQAGEVLNAHNEQAENIERAALDGLVGRSTAARDLLRLRGQSEKSAREAAQLQARSEAARLAEEERLVELNASRREHHLRFKAVTKLEKLLERLDKRTTSRRVALAELSEEGEGASRPSPTVRR